MREIDLSANELICAGEDARDLWPLKEKSQLQLLEKKESFCSWFQAKNGTVEDQIPALKVGEKFYSMPMKLQKIIFRHVRLNNTFRNIEHTATGREKLWIPQTLLREKLRTARRFMDMRKRASHAVQGGGVSKTASGGTGKTKSKKGNTTSSSSCASNAETASTPPSEEDAAKSPEKLPSPMLSFLETVILSGPQLTEFHVSDEEYLKDILQLVRHDCPTLVGNSVDLLKRLKTVERK